MPTTQHEGNNTVATIMIAIAIFVAGWLGGSMWKENKLLKAGGVDSLKKQANVDQPTEPEKPKGPSVEQLNKMPKVTQNDHALGDVSKAQVVMVEYSDLECPFCKRFHPTTKKILDDYGDKVALVWRQYPLPFHKNAEKAAETGECVAKDAGNKAYWKYMDLYFEKTDSSGTGVSEEEMLDLAAKAGANKTHVATCVKSGEMVDKIEKETSAGTTAGVQGTPGTIVVVNGEAKELIPGALPYEQVKQIIGKYIKE